MTDWLVHGLVPAGAVVTIADLSDPEPEELFAQGYDVVLRLHDHGDRAFTAGAPLLFSAHWRPGLVPGHEPPSPFWIRFDRERGGWVRVEEAA